MKRIFLVIALALSIITTGFAQKSNVIKAKNKALAVEEPDYQGAKDAIEIALTNAETKDLANTWWVAGLVYEKAADAEYVLIQTGGGNPLQMGEDALKSYNYYLRANELDQLPNEKGKIKPKFTKRIKNSMYNIYNKSMFIYYAIEKNNSKNFVDAYKAFDLHTSILDLPFIVNQKDVPAKDSTYYQYKYYAASCAWAGELTDNAINLFNSLKDKGYNENGVYQSLSQIYLNDKDTVNYINILNEGLNKFPEEFYYLGNLINHYVFGGEPQKATELLNKAIASDPNNAQLYSVRGSMLEMLEDIDGAMLNFDKALEINPQFFDAWIGKGRLVYNKAFKIEQKALEIRDFRLSEIETQKAFEVYKESIPYFEKALEIKPDDFDTMKTLRSLFYKLSNSDSSFLKKYNEMDMRMNQ